MFEFIGTQKTEYPDGICLIFITEIVNLDI